MTGLFTMRLFLSVMLLSACTGCVRVRLPEAKVGPGLAAETLSWEQAVDLTLRYHPDVLKAQADLRSAAHARNAAFGDYLPDVDGSFTRKHSRTTSTAPSADSMSFDLDVTQPLFAGGAVTGEFLQAKREWEAARFAYRETSADVRQRLRASFAELLRVIAMVEKGALVPTIDQVMPLKDAAASSMTSTALKRLRAVGLALAMYFAVLANSVLNCRISRARERITPK